MSLEIRGIERVLIKLKEVDVLAQEAAGPASSKAGQKVESAAARRAPRRTGRLAGGIAVSSPERQGDVIFTKVGPGKEEFWGKFQERGTRKMRAHPFLVPGMEESERAVRTVIGQVIGAALRRL